MKALGVAVVLAALPAAGPHPKRIPSPGGEVFILDERAQRAYDNYHFAPARRVGDMLYVSGVIVGRGEGEGTDVAAFKAQTRRSLQRIETLLKAAGATFADVAMMNTFHVWQGPNFSGTRDQQFEAFKEVLGEFTSAPWPAWTAIGTTGLLSDGGIVEVQVIARVPAAR